MDTSNNSSTSPGKLIRTNTPKLRWPAGCFAELYRNDATCARNYGNTRPKKVAGGANVNVNNRTEVLMRKVPLFTVLKLIPNILKLEQL